MGCPAILWNMQPSAFPEAGAAQGRDLWLDPVRIDYFFPHLAYGNAYALSDISIVNGMKIGGRASRSRWRRPDGRMEPIVFPPAPNLVELALEPSISLQ